MYLPSIYLGFFQKEKLVDLGKNFTKSNGIEKTRAEVARI